MTREVEDREAMDLIVSIVALVLVAASGRGDVAEQQVNVGGEPSDA
jgi:hypothetical protein